MRRIADIVSFDANPVNEAQTAVTESITPRETSGRLAKPVEWNKSETLLDPDRQDCEADVWNLINGP